MPVDDSLIPGRNTQHPSVILHGNLMVCQLCYTRMNHDVKGWHFRMKNKAKKGQLSFYMLICFLHEEVMKIKMQVCLLDDKNWFAKNTGNTARHRRPSSMSGGLPYNVYAPESSSNPTTLNNMALFGALYRPEGLVYMKSKFSLIK